MKLLDAEAIGRLIRAPDLIEPLRAAFAAEITVPRRSHFTIGDGDEPASLLVKPAWRAGGSICVKIVSVFPGNRGRNEPSVNGLLLVLAGDSGRPLAILDGALVTALRTAAVSALAADILAPPSARTLLMVGTGALAPHVVEAHCAVRPLTRVLVWGRSPDKARSLVARLAAVIDGVEATTNLEAAARAADVVSCATLSQEPLIRGAWLKNGAHLDLIGGFQLQMREADDDAMAAGGLAVDTDVAFDEAGDLAQPVTRGRISRRGTPDLAALVKGLRPAPGRITVFKSVGTAVADLGAAEEILRRAQARPRPETGG
jgi:ornithine cyclodeaminase/alanine dehydrogenase-like protein (mu-crystallin family)